MYVVGSSGSSRARRLLNLGDVLRVGVRSMMPRPAVVTYVGVFNEKASGPCG